MGLFDDTGEEPQSRVRRYIVSGAVLALLLSIGIWYIFRYHTEKKTVETFLGAVTAGNLQEAYRLWQPKPSYTYQDFVDDWGEKGYYGPVRSFRIETAQSEGGSSGVIVIVELSPFTPFPGDNEKEKQSEMKGVRLWVESKTQALGFAPAPLR